MKKYSRSINLISSTVFLVLASLLPYTDVFLDFFIDTKSIEMERFKNLSAAIWSYSMPISNLLILYIVKKKNPHTLAYIFPIYVNITMLCGFLFLDMNLHIESDWVFRAITLGISLLLFFSWKLFFTNYFNTAITEDKVDYELNKLTELKSNDQRTA